MNGAVGVGYRLFDEIFYGKKILIPHGRRVLAKSKLNVINDYSSITGKGSEFLYRAIETTESLAMRRPKFVEQMDDEIIKQRKQEIAIMYRRNIQQPLHQHRKDTAKSF